MGRRRTPGCESAQSRAARREAIGHCRAGAGYYHTVACEPVPCAPESVGQPIRPQQRSLRLPRARPGRSRAVAAGIDGGNRQRESATRVGSESRQRKSVASPNGPDLTMSHPVASTAAVAQCPRAVSGAGGVNTRAPWFVPAGTRALAALLVLIAVAGGASVRAKVALYEADVVWHEGGCCRPRRGVQAGAATGSRQGDRPALPRGAGAGRVARGERAGSRSAVRAAHGDGCERRCRRCGTAPVGPLRRSGGRSADRGRGAAHLEQAAPLAAGLAGRAARRHPAGGRFGRRRGHRGAPPAGGGIAWRTAGAAVARPRRPGPVGTAGAVDRRRTADSGCIAAVRTRRRADRTPRPDDIVGSPVVASPCRRRASVGVRGTAPRSRRRRRRAGSDRCALGPLRKQRARGGASFGRGVGQRRARLQGVRSRDSGTSNLSMRCIRSMSWASCSGACDSGWSSAPGWRDCGSCSLSVRHWPRTRAISMGFSRSDSCRDPAGRSTP